ncbi:taurine dioxygenase [Sphingomonas trueperi]|uniref:TauD/TfdA dioxygenase family protein n=1 Tax=Sphingomonas trueperi TaxID=53317 RepID=UPI003392E1A9
MSDRSVAGDSFVAVLPTLDAPSSQLLETWRHHPVLIFRDLDLSPERLVRFSRTFGEPVPAPTQTILLACGALPPDIMVVSNIAQDGRPIGHLGSGDLAWHTDMCYTRAPAIASALYAVEAPREGGDTWFMDMAAVYDRLPERLRRHADRLQCKHDDSCTAAGDLRHGRVPVTDVTTSSGAIHPLVTVHPASGRRALYLGRRLHAYLVGMEVAESEALLDEYWGYCRDPATIVRHRWRPGDLVLWDNRVTMHRRDLVPGGARRLMWRTQMRPG